MRLELELNVDEYMQELQKREWAVAKMGYHDLEVRLKTAMQDFVQDQIDDNAEWYLNHIEGNLGLSRITEAEKAPKEPRSIRPYKIVKKDK